MQERKKLMQLLTQHKDTYPDQYTSMQNDLIQHMNEYEDWIVPPS